MKADLPYIDYNAIPECREYIPQSVENRYTHGMYCATLPTIYIFREDYSAFYQVAFIYTPLDQYEFDDQILYAKSVAPCKLWIL